MAVYTEETASPGLWKSEIVGVMALVLIAAAFFLPATVPAIYLNWFIGLPATLAAIGEEGNRIWERPLGVAAGFWLFVSGFMPSMLSGSALMINYLAIGGVLLLTAISAQIHLRDDIRHDRPIVM
jgi:hypothetical protein